MLHGQPTCLLPRETEKTFWPGARGSRQIDPWHESPLPGLLMAVLTLMSFRGEGAGCRLDRALRPPTFRLLYDTILLVGVTPKSGCIT